MRDSTPRNVNLVAIVKTERRPATGTNTRSHAHTLFKAHAPVGRAGNVHSGAFPAMLPATQPGNIHDAFRRHTHCVEALRFRTGIDWNGLRECRAPVGGA